MLHENAFATASRSACAKTTRSPFAIDELSPPRDRTATAAALTPRGGRRRPARAAVARGAGPHRCRLGAPAGCCVAGG
eukprot:13561002-Alexandrium_andersonii.AAC.1